MLQSSIKWQDTTTVHKSQWVNLFTSHLNLHSISSVLKKANYSLSSISFRVNICITNFQPSLQGN